MSTALKNILSYLFKTEKLYLKTVDTKTLDGQSTYSMSIVLDTRVRVCFKAKNFILV